MRYIAILSMILLSACAHLPHEQITNLVGKTSQQIQSKFGTPTTRRIEGETQIWSYYKKGCSTIIFIDKDGIVQYAEKTR